MYEIVGKSELGSCPASVDMETGKISLNRDVFRRYSGYEWHFIREHEKGHYNLQTDSEADADAYALRKVFGTQPKSLKNSLELLKKMNISDQNRWLALYQEALKIDAENGNENAKEELKNLNKMMKNSLFFNPSEILTPTVTPAVEKKILTSERSRYKRGIAFNNMFFSFEFLALALILIVLIAKK